MNKSIYAAIAALPLALGACQNADIQHPDFDYQTIYFANQTPVQTITLGEDGEFDVTMDNEHRFLIFATMGGVNSNKQNRWAKYIIDPTLVNGLEFTDGGDVKALPSSYYTITSDPEMIYINSGSIMGAIDITLTDAFFADPETPFVTYVVPVRLVEASDSILSGAAKDGIDSPNILDETHWMESKLPRSYTLYGIKYKNRWHGTWLSRGTVETDNNGDVNTTTHQHEYWESEDIHYLSTLSLTKSKYTFEHAVNITNAAGDIEEQILTCDVILDIDENTGAVVVTSGTEGCTVSGSGTYTYHGAGQAWGALERDLIELDFTYTIPYTVNVVTNQEGTYKVHVTEKLVSRDRQSKFETFSYVIK